MDEPKRQYVDMRDLSLQLQYSAGHTGFQEVNPATEGSRTEKPKSPEMDTGKEVKL